MSVGAGEPCGTIYTSHAVVGTPEVVQLIIALLNVIVAFGTDTPVTGKHNGSVQSTNPVYKIVPIEV